MGQETVRDWGAKGAGYAKGCGGSSKGLEDVFVVAVFPKRSSQWMFGIRTKKYSDTNVGFARLYFHMRLDAWRKQHEQLQTLRQKWLGTKCCCVSRELVSWRARLVFV
jgi:hypothetical protein